MNPNPFEKNVELLQLHLNTLSHGRCLVCTFKGEQTVGKPTTQRAIKLLRHNRKTPGYAGVAKDPQSGYIYIDAFDHFRLKARHIAAALAANFGNVNIAPDSISIIPLGK